MCNFVRLRFFSAAKVEDMLGFSARFDTITTCCRWFIHNMQLARAKLAWSVFSRWTVWSSSITSIRQVVQVVTTWNAENLESLLLEESQVSDGISRSGQVIWQWEYHEMIEYTCIESLTDSIVLDLQWRLINFEALSDGLRVKAEVWLIWIRMNSQKKKTWLLCCEIQTWYMMHDFVDRKNCKPEQILNSVYYDSKLLYGGYTGNTTYFLLLLFSPHLRRRVVTFFCYP